MSGPFGLALALKLPIYWTSKHSRLNTFCQMTGRFRERDRTAIRASQMVVPCNPARKGRKHKRGGAFAATH
jgi:hypothetical protein